MKVMTKFNTQTLWGAALLAGLTLSACSANDDLAGNGTNNGSQASEVKTEFALNIPRAAGSSSRATAAQTQGDGASFLGMENIHLLAFSSDPEAASNPATKWTKNIALASIQSSEFTATGENQNTTKVYSDVNVPLQTSHFIFYGNAAMGTSSTDYFSKGVFSQHFSTEDPASTSEITFALKDITTSSDLSAQSTGREKLIELLNSVASAKATVGTDEKPWSGQSDNKLAAAYKAFTGLTAGSSASILATLEALYNNVNTEASASDNSEASAIAKAIQDAIVPTEGAIISKSEKAPYTLSWSSKDGAYANYPGSIDLPDGAVAISWSSTDSKFSYDDEKTTITSITGLKPTDICYPAPVAYYKSTNIYTNTKAVDANNWPTTPSNWENTSSSFTPQAGWQTTDAAVQANTQAIALAKSIDYGVASLKLTVKAAKNNLSDGATEAASIPVGDNKFQLTAIIIGGQPAEVGYNFQPGAEEKFEKYVYDKVLETEGIYLKTTQSSANYSIVLPSKTPSTSNDNNEDATAKVNFALEFVNNSGSDFTGVQGIIPAGGKFYLVGQLDPLSGKKPSSNSSNDQTNYAVFMSDYQTTANVTINSLKSAYNTIPDLRSTKQQLGLSVDLQWEKGLEFDITIE